MSSSSRRVQALLAVVSLLVAAACGTGPGPSQARFTPEVPADVRALSVRVSADVAAALPARAGCLAGTTIDADRDLSARARYLPATATVVLRIPATAPQLASALIHELAHHVEHTCADHVELRGPFLAAQGHPPGTDWFAGARWEDRPSEQYAEAMIVHVQGRRGFRRQMRIEERAVAVLAAWAGCPVGGCPAPR